MAKFSQKLQNASWAVFSFGYHQYQSLLHSHTAVWFWIKEILQMVPEIYKQFCIQFGPIVCGGWLQLKS